MILNMWILWKMWFWKCQLFEKCDFERVNFWTKSVILPQCGRYRKKKEKLGKNLKNLDFHKNAIFHKITLFQISNSSAFMDKKCDFAPVCSSTTLM